MFLLIHHSSFINIELIESLLKWKTTEPDEIIKVRLPVKFLEEEQPSAASSTSSIPASASASASSLSTASSVPTVVAVSEKPSTSESVSSPQSAAVVESSSNPVPSANTQKLASGSTEQIQSSVHASAMKAPVQSDADLGILFTIYNFLICFSFLQ